MNDEVARRVFRELQALARVDYGANTGALLVVYAVEGFLRRLAASDYASKMTLKGGMLMAALSARRMTRDADLSTAGVANEEAQVAAVVGEIVAVELGVDDGLRFDTESIRAEVMREEAEYHGVRIKVVAHLATANITTTLDFSFGDPHRSTVIELPELLLRHQAALGHRGRRRASQPTHRSIVRGTGRHARPPGFLRGDAQPHGLPARPAGNMERAARRRPRVRRPVGH